MEPIKAFDDVARLFPEETAPFQHKYQLQRKGSAPLRGLRIHQNIPLTIETLFKVHGLRELGANVSTSNIKLLPTNPRWVEFLERHDIRFVDNHEDLRGEPIDIALDCCADLLGIVTPKLGAAELTRSGARRYQEAAPPYPVISVDDSMLKNLETCLGTGEAFVRTLKTLLPDLELRGKKALIFGFGKVGRGVGLALRGEGVLPAFADPSLEARLRATEFGFVSLDAEDQRGVQESATRAEIIITATGLPHIMTTVYGHLKPFFADKLLTNIGAEDEWGPLYDAQEVFCKKMPINFALEHATLMKYLDPSFAAHSYAAELLLSGAFGPGYHPLPRAFDDSIVTEWCRLFGHDKASLLAMIS